MINQILLLSVATFLCVFSCNADLVSEEERPYQDVIIKNQVIRKGVNNSYGTYELIKPILKQFQGEFSFLDLGAAQGYFSLRVAHDFPKSKCIMIDENTPNWPYHGDMLQEICEKNNHLKNISYLRKRISLNDLKTLNSLEHFDVLLASFIIHAISPDLEEQKKIFSEFLKLADNVILQISHLVASSFTKYIEEQERLGNCVYLGDVSRYTKPYPEGVFPGYVYWFKSEKNVQREKPIPTLGVSENTFKKFNGCFPKKQ